MDRVPVAGSDWGRAPTLLFLCVVLLATLQLGRWRAVEVDPQSGHSALLEGTSAWRLRRIALALESSRLGQWDSFLSFPEAAGASALPLYDHALALGLRVWSGGAVGGSKRAVDEALLERGASGVGPCLAALFSLALFLWLRSVARVGRRSAALAVLAASLAPATLAAGQAGSLVLELVVALELLAASAVACWMFQARSVLDRFTFAMLAGGLFGLGLATSPLFLIAVAALWAAVLFECLRCAGEERREWVRALLLFGISAVLGALLPALGGPWLEVREGIVHAWTQFCLGLALAGLLPFLAFVWLPGLSLAPPIQRTLPALLVVLVVVAIWLAGILGADQPSLALLFASIGRSVDTRPPALGVASQCTLAVLGLVCASELLRRWKQTWDVRSVFLVLWGAGAWCLAWLHEPAALLFMAPAAAALALGFERRAAWASRTALCALLLLAAWSSEREHSHPDLEGLAALAAARHLRQTTAASGPWNSIHPVQAWGVLADQRLAPLMAWYGQRACASLGPARNGDGLARERLLTVLQAPSYEDFEAGAQKLGLRWILWGTGSAQRLPLAPPLLAALKERAAAAAPHTRGAGAVLLRIGAD